MPATRLMPTDEATDLIELTREICRQDLAPQVVEEIASVWMSVAVGVSVHSLTAYPVATFGTHEQQEALLPGMLSGEQLGAYCLSEPLAGSDIASMTTRATRSD